MSQFWGTYLGLEYLPRTKEMGTKALSVLYVICPQSHLLRSIFHPTESLAIGPQVSPLCLSSGPGPGRLPCHFMMKPWTARGSGKFGAEFVSLWLED